MRFEYPSHAKRYTPTRLTLARSSKRASDSRTLHVTGSPLVRGEAPARNRILPTAPQGGFFSHATKADSRLAPQGWLLLSGARPCGRRRALRHGHYRKERDFTHFRWAPSSTLFVPGLSHVQSETCCLALWGRGSHHGNVLGQHARRGSCL